MTSDEIKALIDAMAASDLAVMEVVKDGWTLRLTRHARSRPNAELRPDVLAPAPQPVAATVEDIQAPLSGIVYLSPTPDAPPFVAVGDAVEAGALLCTVEAMKTFNEVRAERAGTVAAVLVASGDEVSVGQPLVRFA